MPKIKLAKYGTQFSGIHFPVNCLYTIKRDVKTGEKFALYCANIDALLNKEHAIFVRVSSCGKTKEIYLNLNHGIAKEFRDFAQVCTQLKECIPVRTKREKMEGLETLVPKEKRIAPYIQRPIMPTEKESSGFVTNGTRISGHAYRPEGYNAIRLKVFVRL